jgi:Ca-activated chloride channel family protein
MSFAWPWALLALVAGPALLAVLWWRQRRRRRLAVRVSNVAVVRAAVPPRSHWKRRVPLALLVAALVALGLAAGRPTAHVTVARSATSVLLAIDVSRSMCSTDVPPNRLVVAKEAARTFIRDQDDGTRIGIVAFAGFAGLVVPPTTDTERLIEAIDKLSTSRGTAIGMAILASLDAIAEYNSDVAPTGVDLGAGPLPTTPDTVPPAVPAAPPTGNFQPDTIVVLTDGANTEGVLPLVAAEQAAARRVRVYAIGFGTTEPSQPVCSRDQLAGDVDDFGGFDPGPPGGGGPGGPGARRFLEIDEETLLGVADLTGGQYFRAEDADQLADVFQRLPSEVVSQQVDEELSVWFVLAAAVLAAEAIGLSLWWNRYP